MLMHCTGVGVGVGGLKIMCGADQTSVPDGPSAAHLSIRAWCPWRWRVCALAWWTWESCFLRRRCGRVRRESGGGGGVKSLDCCGGGEVEMRRHKSPKDAKTSTASAAQKSASKVFTMSADQDTCDFASQERFLLLAATRQGETSNLRCPSSKRVPLMRCHRTSRKRYRQRDVMPSLNSPSPEVECQRLTICTKATLSIRLAASCQPSNAPWHGNADS
ncbi:hypothetical protein P280DRAFT_300669 [Massarina eburnea CBS 473.64]|uniref:Uncharacterized protein n=1 Tax=Massarina eburnea CBS 473.64 TaxID=1395130 RepID=A0A6A6S138_9PLEO|nr:hypothetical protein P280DRAFT_300669 [Massarina eburnea CBS 473.64]